jgi:histidine ammonia-lyase
MTLHRILCGLAAATALCLSLPTLADEAFQPINATMADKTITLTGKDLTIEQVVAVARYGAKVVLSPEAKQRSADRYGILLESAAEASSPSRATRSTPTTSRTTARRCPTTSPSGSWMPTSTAPRVATAPTSPTKS